MNTTAGLKTRKVLLAVEDNAGDARLIKECLKGAKEAVEFSVVENGLDAMAFLRQQGNYENAPRPDIVLLDLRLPIKNGRAVLAEIKQDPRLRRIPVVILTSSEADDDIAECYELGANGYVTKPMDLDSFARVVQSLADFWLGVAQLPRG